MRIIVLDGYALNLGDLSWGALARLGDLTVYDRTDSTELLERARGAEILFTNKTVVSADAICSLSSLRYIGVLATGYDVVGVVAAKQRGIAVCNVSNYGSLSVAQMVFAHILNFCQNVSGHGADVAQGGWTTSPDFCYWKTPLIELSGLTLGIVDMGEIGKATARLGQAFGVRVIAAARNTSRTPPDGVAWVTLDDLFRQADFVSLHCPLTPETEKLVDAERIQRMKRGAFIVNTGRGQLIDEMALADALNEGRIAGAGLDVLSVEPPATGNVLLSARNCVITPRITWATKAARARLLGMAADNLRNFLDGKITNQVNS